MNQERSAEANEKEVIEKKILNEHLQKFDTSEIN